MHNSDINVPDILLQIMACILPQRIINPHYKKLSDESGVRLSFFENNDDYYLDVPCGKCYHCIKSYKHQWNFRLQTHYSYLSQEAQRNSYFVTLTYDENNLPKHSRSAISRTIRLFLERVRKLTKKSVTHWFVTEFGERTHRLHLHGILFDVPFPIYKLGLLWKYGFVSYRPLNEKRITYVTTYITKMDKDIIQLPENKQYVFTSPAIGKSYLSDPKNIAISHVNGRPNPFGYFNNRPIALPRYLRKFLFSQEELDILKRSYFYFLSEDVIPDGPYYIANRLYTDYTDFKQDSDSLRNIYNSLYKFNKHSIWLNEMPTTPLLL